MERLQVTATFPNITPDNLAQFKQSAADALKAANEEPGVLQYDWFFNADESKCVVRETFEGSDAVLGHLAAVGAILGPIVELGGGLQLEVFGSPSEQLTQALVGLSPTYYSAFQGK